MIEVVDVGIPDWIDLSEYDYAYKSGEKYGTQVWDFGEQAAGTREMLAQLARSYAGRFGARASCQSHMQITRYLPGMYDPEHIDQYEGREGQADTIDRTVSVSLMLQRAERGGILIFQDHERRNPPIALDPKPGEAVLFPGDCWHQVSPVESGVRHSLIAWFADGTGERWRMPYDD